MFLQLLLTIIYYFLFNAFVIARVERIGVLNSKIVDFKFKFLFLKTFE